jgi:hypothetical protein
MDITYSQVIETVSSTPASQQMADAVGRNIAHVFNNFSPASISAQEARAGGVTPKRYEELKLAYSTGLSCLWDQIDLHRPTFYQGIKTSLNQLPENRSQNFNKLVSLACMAFTPAFFPEMDAVITFALNRGTAVLSSGYAQLLVKSKSRLRYTGHTYDDMRTHSADAARLTSIDTMIYLERAGMSTQASVMLGLYFDHLSRVVSRATVTYIDSEKAPTFPIATVRGFIEGMKIGFINSGRFNPDGVQRLLGRARELRLIS